MAIRETLPPVVKTVSATIPAGESVSNSVDLTAAVVTMLVAPSEWNAACISFLTSTDNVTFSNLYDNRGAQITRRFVRGVAMPIDPEITRSTVYLKIRSGTAQIPIVQDADRTFQLVLTS